MKQGLKSIHRASTQGESSMDVGGVSLIHTESSVNVSCVRSSHLEGELSGCHWHERKCSQHCNYCYGYVVIKSSRSHQNMDVLDGIKC